MFHVLCQAIAAVATTACVNENMTYGVRQYGTEHQLSDAVRHMAEGT